MPLSPPGARTPLHDRDITCRGFARSDGLFDIEARLRDCKHYDFDNRARGKVNAGEAVHDMWIRITLNDELVIHAAEAVTDASPFRECPAVAPSYAKLVGLKIGPGWMREVSRRLGGVLGCTHLTELLRPVATTAFQTMSQRRREQASSAGPARRPVIIDTCHALAADGAVVRHEWPEFYTGDTHE